jgi:hypothetical protein
MEGQQVYVVGAGNSAGQVAHIGTTTGVPVERVAGGGRRGLQLRFPAGSPATCMTCRHVRALVMTTFLDRSSCGVPPKPCGAGPSAGSPVRCDARRSRHRAPVAL